MGRLWTTFYCFPKQAEFLFGIPEENFHKTKNGMPIIHRDVACYQGGFASGKTYCGAMKGLFLALKYPGIRGFVGASTQDLIDNTTKAQYVKQPSVEISADQRRMIKMLRELLKIHIVTAPDHFSFDKKPIVEKVADRIFHDLVDQQMVRRSVRLDVLRYHAALAPLTEQLLTRQHRNQVLMPQSHASTSCSLNRSIASHTSRSSCAVSMSHSRYASDILFSFLPVAPVGQRIFICSRQ